MKNKMYSNIAHFIIASTLVNLITLNLISAERYRSSASKYRNPNFPISNGPSYYKGQNKYATFDQRGKKDQQNEQDQNLNKIPGEGGVDYPMYHSVPDTGFSCDKVPFAPGMYANVETGCQAYHVCHDGREGDQGAAFLCSNGTLFNQKEFACDWWYKVDCKEAPDHYKLNEYKETNPFVPKVKLEDEDEESSKNANFVDPYRNVNKNYYKSKSSPFYSDSRDYKNQSPSHSSKGYKNSIFPSSDDSSGYKNSFFPPSDTRGFKNSFPPSSDSKRHKKPYTSTSGLKGHKKPSSAFAEELPSFHLNPNPYPRSSSSPRHGQRTHHETNRPLPYPKPTPETPDYNPFNVESSYEPDQYHPTRF